MKTYTIPEIGNEEVEVTEIEIKEEEKVKPEQTLITVEGQKISIDIPSTVKGKVKEILVKIGQKIKTGTPFIKIESDEHITSKEEKENKKEEDQKVEKSQKGREEKRKEEDKEERKRKSNKEREDSHASPTVRRLAREYKVELSEIKGTGRKGRVLKEDIKVYLKGREDNSTLFLSSSKENVFVKNSSSGLNLEKENRYFFNRVEMSAVSQLKKNWSSVPHVTQFAEADITELNKLKKSFSEDFFQEENLYSLTYLPFIIKALCCALKKFSKFNSVYSDTTSSLLFKKSLNIGIVVDSKEGLFIPVLKKANEKSILDIAKEVFLLSEKTRQKKLLLSDVQESTFTVSNLGGVGGSFFTPIVNSPEVGILGISRASLKPTWVIDKILPRLILPLSLSYDHRVINGVYAVNFLNLIIKLLSNVALLTVY
ncbi:Dihydrolipoyllysine-residue acetyltransferase component of pyruvate dehydrogenase complex [Buchnera aphidicola (Anoecia corni)]|uniref:Dihydrolipoamide acetyltransferase component of pyruvate dehydrogenase complex n=1 Tax=Buchnera aphidicola (Anoecia corni) TaxID=2994477 RepID=A0AAT9IGE6_9GAMM